MDGIDTFGLVGFVMAMVCMFRINNLEKKLKQFDVIPRDFDSGKEPKDGETE
jgi:hypothetical protein